MTKNILRIVISSPFYLPGYQAGGALRTVVNLVNQLKLNSDFEIYIITSDRDSRMDEAYENIPTEKWFNNDGVNIYYVDSKKLTMEYWRHLLNSIEYDVLYLNSFFSFAFSIRPLVLLRLGKLLNKNVIMAPRGEMGAGALSIKPFKKRLFIRLFIASNLHRFIEFQASSEFERDDIKDVFGEDIKITISPDLPVAPPREIVHLGKQIGELKLIFLSRITPVKNLYGALSALEKHTGSCQLNIYGPISDKDYWDKCQKLILTLPSTIEVLYHGEAKYSDVGKILSSNHFLFLLTQGENFGHVIFESLSNGCPLIISNKTIWRGLKEIGVGWDLETGNYNLINEILVRCQEMDNETYNRMRLNAHKYALEYITEGDALADNCAMFNKYK